MPLYKIKYITDKYTALVMKNKGNHFQMTRFVNIGGCCGILLYSNTPVVDICGTLTYVVLDILY